ncbi:MAG TPA: RNA methyltransferase [Burkholderiales bacterium]|nr:RNA methyltransferase [Burkholderiales bacterium]
MAEIIVSSQNPQYKNLKKLVESSGARREQQQTVLDGEHLLQAYLQSGNVPRLLIVEESAVEPPLLAQWRHVPAMQLTPRLFSALSPVKTPTGVMALIDIPAVKQRQTSSFIVLLERIQDPGNLGAMLRSAAAAGADAVYLSEGCADAWSPKVLRGGMGAHFATQIIEQADLVGVARDFSGKTCCAALAAPQSLYDVDLSSAVAFAVGNEGAGLSPELRAAADIEFSIPMPGNVESLNAAAALAVCAFERVRQISGTIVKPFVSNDRAGASPQDDI